MDRKSFIKASMLIPFLGMEIKDFEEALGENALMEKMPVLFVGHGNPMNAIMPNEYSKKWKAIGEQLPTPKAILCVSAHWQTRGTQVTAMPQPKTIHDFGGFPKSLFEVEYPAPGISSALAQKTIEAIKEVHVTKDFEWGLDHGCWSVLKPMFPKANIPTFQLSLDYLSKPETHFKIGMQLQSLRQKGVLIIGSGNLVHNLGKLSHENKPHDWAIEFDELAKNKILEGNFASLVGYKGLGKAASLSIPTNEHYLPLLYTLALKQSSDSLQFFNESIDMGSISMRSLLIGA
ncbi:MAG: 4,5-DOPA dioxygenase extradiol [Bacteroidia bacterium]|nr:4,5-DOPA dioxygenase extradiol [Bacteroidia bacterium]MCF8425265.1 4,5-DOPA dioxygenase extradiol [Bacteroidia bacterium]MCF8446513.1 4,5-DOPA dioxygenase extradiol [Bacteroidia bacterium]